jgi:hypothetical protein
MVHGVGSLVNRMSKLQLGFAGCRTGNSETLRNAKGWLADRMGGQGYHETLDQPKFASAFDMEFAHTQSRSFRKLCEDWSVCVAEVGRQPG